MIFILFFFDSFCPFDVDQKLGMTEVYFVHDNGGRPFKVEITGSSIQVFERVYPPIGPPTLTSVSEEDQQVFIDQGPENENEIFLPTLHQPTAEIPTYSQKVLELDGVHQIWIGNDDSNVNEHGSSEWANGNSILIKKNHVRYIWIGQRIIEFASKAPIISFRSPVKNSNVPYCWAEDDQGNRYLFIEFVIFKPPEQFLDCDPYYVYYCFDHTLSQYINPSEEKRKELREEWKMEPLCAEIRCLRPEWKDRDLNHILHHLHRAYSKIRM